MYKSAFLILVMFLVSGCDAVSDMKGAFNKSTEVQENILKEAGLEVQIGFNISNGVLAQVTVMFRADQVGERSINDLQKIALKGVASSFESTPRMLNVTVMSEPDDEEYK